MGGGTPEKGSSALVSCIYKMPVLLPRHGLLLEFPIHSDITYQQFLLSASSHQLGGNFVHAVLAFNPTFLAHPWPFLSTALTVVLFMGHTTSP